MKCGIWIIVVGFWAIGVTTEAGDWSSFRGPAGTGVSTEKGIPRTWGPEENIIWKVPMPGPGNGSPIVSGGKVFINCALEEGRQRSLHCFDRTNGEQLWVRTVRFDQVMPTHKTNPYCASTPATDGERVVVWHGSAGLFCYDFEGTQLWSKDLGEFRHTWGYASSPVINNKKIFLNAGPGKRVFMICADLRTGRTIWKKEEPVSGDGVRNEDNHWIGSWSTPVIAKVDGKDQIICSMNTRVLGYDPKTGKILWTCDGLRGYRGDLAYSSPVIGEGFCVVISGFSGPSIGLELGGSGNVTDTHRRWRIEKSPQNIGSGVLVGDHCYIAYAGPGILQCLEARTGRVVWKDRAAGSNHWGSIIFVDGLLYVTNQNGTTVVFEPNPERFQFVAFNELGEPSNSTPAFSDGQIFLRTFEHLYCIGKK